MSSEYPFGVSLERLSTVQAAVPALGIFCIGSILLFKDELPAWAILCIAFGFALVCLALGYWSARMPQKNLKGVVRR